MAVTCLTASTPKTKQFSSPQTYSPSPLQAATMAAGTSETMIADVPDVILSDIFSTIADTRSRNSLSLLDQKLCEMERSTRTSLTLRGNGRYLHAIPVCFTSVNHLDLSKLYPWGHQLLTLCTAVNPNLLAGHLAQAFPLVDSLTVYCRSPSTLDSLLPQWPGLRHLKLVRWHKRPQAPLLSGADFIPLFEHCESLTSLDLSNFYFWTEDLPPVLKAYPNKSANLTSLNLLATPSADFFKSNEISQIAAACPNLNKFQVVCRFDERFFGFVGDDTLTAISTNCPQLSLLHLADRTSLATARGDPENDGFTAEEATISTEGLLQLFCGLPFLEELVLDVGKHVNLRGSGSALEVLTNSRCVNLKVLKLGHFHGVCLATDRQRLDGVAFCGGLESLSIKNCGDLNDKGLLAIGRGCCRLAKFEVVGCKNITFRGLRAMASLRRDTLVEVNISCCKQLTAFLSCKSMEPVRHCIEKLHIDCVWDGFEFEGTHSSVHTFHLNKVYNDDGDDLSFRAKKRKTELSRSEVGDGSSNANRNGNLSEKWERLKYLSLWIKIGDPLTPLPMVGLIDCPELEEIHIQIEGDTRGLNKPEEPAFGLSCLAQYPRLSKLQLDLSDTLGYYLTAPAGQMDLTIWDRFLLDGIRDLSLNELHYRPAYDSDVNLRSLSLLACEFIAECVTLRKLVVHGTSQEHCMTILTKIPNLRDVQLVQDYYPAPDVDSTSELRIDSYSRFTDAIFSRHVAD